MEPVKHIRNFEELCEHGKKLTRRNALTILDAGIESAIPYRQTKEMVKLSNNALRIREHEISLSDVDHIYVLGVGKGAYPIALALEEALGDRISKGIVLVKNGDTRRLKYIEIIESGHPLPDQAGIDAALRIRQILKNATSRDVILAPITGGSSAMLNIPPDGVSLDDLITMNKLLLKSGASISKMNTVRKHLCDMKGGRFVEHANPACIHTFTLNTAPPELLWPDLAHPDPTTFADAVSVLKTYNMWEETPESVKTHLLAGTVSKRMETPKQLTNKRSYIHYVADPETACEAMAEKARALGYTPHILSVALEGEASSLGVVFAGMANEISKKERPFSGPCALISGGETTVAIGRSKSGVGGPNQETALGFASKLFAERDCVCISLDSDGTDGPTDIAGGISDNLTDQRARDRGLEINHALNSHDTSPFLTELRDAIITGHTGTNVMNLRLVLVEGE